MSISGADRTSETPPPLPPLPPEESEGSVDSRTTSVFGEAMDNLLAEIDDMANQSSTSDESPDLDQMLENVDDQYKGDEHLADLQKDIEEHVRQESPIDDADPIDDILGKNNVKIESAALDIKAHIDAEDVITDEEKNQLLNPDVPVDASNLTDEDLARIDQLLNEIAPSGTTSAQVNVNRDSAHEDAMADVAEATKQVREEKQANKNTAARLPPAPTGPPIRESKSTISPTTLNSSEDAAAATGTPKSARGSFLSRLYARFSKKLSDKDPSIGHSPKFYHTIRDSINSLSSDSFNISFKAFWKPGNSQKSDSNYWNHNNKI